MRKSTIRQRAEEQGRYLRVIHEGAESELLRGKKLLTAAERASIEDYHSEDRPALPMEHPEFMAYFILGYTRTRIAPELEVPMPQVKDVTLEEALAYSNRYIEDYQERENR